jgi:hypothetical protein
MRYPYLRIPIDADRGFPQAFGMALDGQTYLLSFSVTVLDEELLTATEPLELPRQDAYAVLTVSRPDGNGERTLLRRKLAPFVEYETDELAFMFTELAVHPRNINGTGAFGSRITGGVAARWVS